jgi:NCS2 family nucleobase:cation symporter-2
VNTVPYPVLGGGVIVMFGMVASAGISMLSDVKWNKRNMVIFAVALTMGLGMQQVPGAMKFLPDMANMLISTGLLPAAIIAIVLNLILPEDAAEG